MFGKMIHIHFVTLSLATFFAGSWACNGYEFKLHYFKPCNDDDSNIMKYKDVGSTVTSDCKLIPTGCMKTDGFKSATIHYRVDKKPMPPLEGDYDLCKGIEAKDEFALIGAKLMGIPDKCPVEKSELCGDGKKSVSIAKYKNKLGLAVGVTFVNLTVKHDTGETCITMKSEFKKVKKLGK